MDTLAPPPKLSHLFTLRCGVAPPMEIGHGPYGRRRCVPITSGVVRGPHLNGEVVPGGADFMYDISQHLNENAQLCEIKTNRDDRIVEEDQTTHVNTNYAIKSDDGAFIYIRYVRPDSNFEWEERLNDNRTEGTRAGPPDVLKALMEGGPVDPSQYWFHLHVRLETGHEKYKWMNNRVIIARATRAKSEIAYDAYFLENSP